MPCAHVCLSAPSRRAWEHENRGVAGHTWWGRSGSMQDLLKPIRAKIHDAAPQLKAARDLGHPLVVVLTNPHSAPVIMGEREMLWAIEGDPIVRVPVTGSAPPVHTVGRNGELRSDHAYVTAVVVLHERLHARDYYDELAEKSREEAHDERIAAILAG